MGLRKRKTVVVSWNLPRERGIRHFLRRHRRGEVVQQEWVRMQAAFRDMLGNK